MKTLQLSKLRRSLLMSVTGLLMSCTAIAQNAVAEPKATQMRATIERNTQGKVKPGAIRSTPIAGMYAVEVGSEIFYVDESGRYGFSGAALIDMQQRQDLTAAHMEQMHRVGFS